MSSKHLESDWKASMKLMISSKNTIEGIRIMVVLAIELSPKCQMQGCICTIKISKIYRIQFENPLRINYKYSNSSVSLIHYLEDIEY